MTAQQHMAAKLAEVPIPSKQINCYGSQIVVTCWSEEAGRKWAVVLRKFSTVKRILKSIDYAKENQSTIMTPSTVDVWRVYATL